MNNQQNTLDEWVDEVLDSVQDYTINSSLGGSPFNSDEENAKYMENAYDKGRLEAKQAILTHISKHYIPKSEVDEMVREAKDEVLDDLLEWRELWESTHREPFNWHGSVKALKVAKDHKKPFVQLSTNKKGGE